MINTRGAAELAQNTWMKDYRALSEMGQCLSLSERRSAPALITMLCSLLLLLAGSGNMSSAPWPLPSDMHRMATSARSEGQFPARSTCSACKSVYRGCTESEKVYSRRTKSLEKESATTLGRKSQFYFTIRKRYRWATPWVSRGSTSTRRTHHQTRLWSSD